VQRSLDMTDEELLAFARRNGLTVDQARQVIDQHGPDESGWSEAARNLVHFFRAPS